MPKVLVTGGSGFIGSHTILQMLAAGHESAGRKSGITGFSPDRRDHQDLDHRAMQINRPMIEVRTTARSLSREGEVRALLNEGGAEAGGRSERWERSSGREPVLGVNSGPAQPFIKDALRAFASIAFQSPASIMPLVAIHEPPTQATLESAR